MIIQSTGVYALSSPSQELPKLRLLFPGTEASAKASGETVSISQAARDLATQSVESGDTYDFSNMSLQQLLETMNNLIKAGKMSIDESSALVGDTRRHLQAAIRRRGTGG